MESVSDLALPPSPDAKTEPAVTRCPVTNRWPVTDTVRCPVTRNHLIEVMRGGFKCEDPSCRCHLAEAYYGDALYESIFRLVYGIARKYKHSLPDGLDDLAQSCFERIIEKLGSFDPDLGEFTTWSWSVCQNVLRTKLLAHGRRAHVFVEMNEYTPEPVYEEEDIDPMFRLDMQGLVLELKTQHPTKVDILDVMFATNDGEIGFRSVADVARTTGRKYNEVLQFVATVVRPYFVERLNAEVTK